MRYEERAYERDTGAMKRDLTFYLSLSSLSLSNKTKRGDCFARKIDRGVWITLSTGIE
jgi:hypothetical protein